MELERAHQQLENLMLRLLADLSKAAKEGRLELRWKIYQRPKLLLIDEIGYSQLDRFSVNLFFQLICSRYEKSSIVLTSNKGWSIICRSQVANYLSAAMVK